MPKMPENITVGKSAAAGGAAAAAAAQPAPPPARSAGRSCGAGAASGQRGRRSVRNQPRLERQSVITGECHERGAHGRPAVFL